MLFGVIDILFSCTPHFFTFEAMVHNYRARSPVVPSEPHLYLDQVS